MSEDLRLIEFEKDGKEVKVYIKKPSATDIQNSELEKARTFKKYLERGDLYLKREMDEVLRKRGVWDDETEQEVEVLRKELTEKLNTLDAGGIKLSDAKKLAVDIAQLRNTILLKLTVRKDFANATVDGLADQAQLDYLVSVCAVYDNDRKKTYFRDYQDYINRKSDDDAYRITQRYAEIMFDTIFDERRLPENEFLIKYKFMNDDLRLVNEDGHLVDIDGNLINENGERVELVGGKEVVVNEFETKPFLDDDGNPI